MRNLNYDAWESESVEYPGILTLLATEGYPNLLAQLFSPGPALLAARPKLAGWGG